MINVKKIFTFLFEISLIFLLFQQTLFPDQFTFISLLFNILSGFLLIILNRKLRVNPFIVSYMFFLVIVFSQVCLGHTASNGIDRFFLFLMQLVSTICIYNYLLLSSDTERFLNIYIFVALISLIMIIVLVGPANIVSSRFGHNGSGAIVSYYFLGNPIHKSSNGTANVCAIAALFCTYFIHIKHKKSYYILFLFFIICCFLCGSRKGLLMLLAFLIYYFFYMSKGITLKKVLYLFVFPAIFMVLIFKVPVFYKIIGIRVESLFYNIVGSSSNSLDGNSYLMRQQVKDLSISWIKQHPFLGNGCGVFASKYGFGSENNFLQIIVDYGFLGFFVYYSYLISFVKTIFKNHKLTVLTSMFSLLIIMLFIQDYGSVTYTWQQTTMWYSIFWAVITIEKSKVKM